jgi:hypothetical protein
MDAKKVLINGENLDIILRHYYAIQPLIIHAMATKDNGGNKALERWDRERAKDAKDIKIEIV